MRVARHVLLTRFNVVHDELIGRGVDGIALTEEWLRHRVELFETICAPSVRSQTTRAFDWLVYVHPSTPAPLCKRIMETSASAGGRVVLSETGRRSDVLDALGSPSADGVLLTTRLDCDDAINRAFMDRLHATASEVAAPAVLNFPDGCHLDEASGMVLRRPHDVSPFLSLVESWTEKPLTVWGFNHMKAHEVGAVHQLRLDLAWMSVIHANNVSNPLYPGPPIARDDVLKAFDLDPDRVAPTSRSDLAARRVRNFVRRGELRAKRRLHRLIRRVRST